jgi:ABC-type transporter MlaC component
MLLMKHLIAALGFVLAASAFAQTNSQADVQKTADQLVQINQAQQDAARAAPAPAAAEERKLSPVIGWLAVPVLVLAAFLALRKK